MPLAWLTAFAFQEFASLERRCRRRRSYWTVITFDGSLSGGGATLQVGVGNLKDHEAAPIVAYWHDEWDTEDRKAVRAGLKDPADQAKFEAYTLLQSIIAWRPLLASTHGSLAIVGDALGVLHDVVKFRAREPILNEIIGEAALHLAPLRLDVRAAHVWTQRNKIFDVLSRMHVKASLPEQLQGATKSERVRVQHRFLGHSRRQHSETQ